MTDVAFFLEELRRQRDLYRRMVAVVEEQKGVLARADMDALVALVDRKQALMREIEDRERALRPTKDRWNDLRAGLEPARVREVEGALAETREVLARIVRLEEEGRIELEKQRASSALTVEGILSRRRAGQAYGRRA